MYHNYYTTGAASNTFDSQLFHESGSLRFLFAMIILAAPTTVATLLETTVWTSQINQLAFFFASPIWIIFFQRYLPSRCVKRGQAYPCYHYESEFCHDVKVHYEACVGIETKFGHQFGNTESLH